MILTVPARRLPELMEGLNHFEKAGMGFKKFAYAVMPNFKQPPFYEEYFKKWGLDAPKSSK